MMSTPTETYLDELRTALASRFTIARPIGRGGMATVYLARERHPDREVAIKVLEPTLANEVGRERFLREIEIASKLTHPHIVPIFVAGEADGFLYYVMPYISAPSLRSRLVADGPLPVHDALHVAHDVADALDYAHKADVVHRDIKPENILLQGGHALVADFGIARAVCQACGDNLTIAGIPIGTPGYMSPEQATGADIVDARSDIYSLACVLYEMLTGRRPFAGDTLATVTVAQQAGMRTPAGPVETVPEPVRAAMRRALAWDPAERFPTCAEFAATLTGAETPHTAWRVTSSGDVSAPAKSLAVLPFANVSADPDNEYFSDGITDDIITQLSKIGDLKVTSRTSVMQYKHATKSLVDIGRELGVAAVLEGSVRRAGKRVRITSQLIDVQSDTHRWAETYDRELTDIFEIQSDVARQIANALQATLLPSEEARIRRHPTDNLEAYHLYLRGQHHWNKFTVESSKKGLASFEQAIALDPDFALAHAGLANVYFSFGVGHGPLTPTDAFGRAKAAAERALELDDTIADAHATLGVAYMWADWDWVAAEREFARARELGKGCEAPHLKYGFFLAARGRHPEAIRTVRQALELDPVSLIVNANLGLQYYWARRYDEAVDQLLRTKELDPAFPPTQMTLGWTYLVDGRPAAALEEFEEMARGTGRQQTYLAALACAYAAVGRRRDAVSALEELQAPGGGYVSPRDIALVHTWLGDHDTALNWLERACDEHAAWLCFLAVDPFWDAIRDAPSFQAVMARVGLT